MILLQVARTTDAYGVSSEVSVFKKATALLSLSDCGGLP